MNKLWPKDYSRDEILTEVNELYKAAESSQIKPGRVTYLLTRAQLGLSHIQIKEQKRDNVFAISIALLSLLATMIFSLLDYIGNKEWQDDQLEILNTINSSLQNK